MNAIAIKINTKKDYNQVYFSQFLFSHDYCKFSVNSTFCIFQAYVFTWFFI